MCNIGEKPASVGGLYFSATVRLNQSELESIIIYYRDIDNLRETGDENEIKGLIVGNI